MSRLLLSVFALCAAGSGAWAQLPARDFAADQVGATPADFRVDESGNASYNIPIYTVPGTAGVQPTLSLSYNSSTPDGVMGKGWTINGASAITRCRSTREHGDFRDASGHPIDGSSDPITFTAADRFCLDGQRLLLTQGTYGLSDSEYRPELDSFTRVTFRTNAQGASVFKVQRKDGSSSFYGNFNGCTLSGTNCTPAETSNRPDAVIYANQIDTNGVLVARSEVMGWMLNRLYDSAQNYIDYEYDTDSVAGEFVLRHVRYTGHARFLGDGTGVTAVAPYATVSFNYDTLPVSSWHIGYQSGHRMVRSKQLASVSSNSIRFYFLTYEDSASGSGSDLLRSVQECRDVAKTLCLPATTFDWLESQQQFVDKEQYNQPEFGKFVDVRFGDMDGDGRQDLVWVKDTEGPGCPTNRIVVSRGIRMPNGKLRFAAPVDTGICTGWDSYTPASTSIRRFWQLLDYNGDGRDDLLIADRSLQRWKVYAARTDILQFDTSVDLLFALAPVIPAVNPAGQFGNLMLGDFNGDGVVDIVYPTVPGSFRVRFLERQGVVANSPFAFSAEHRLDLDVSALEVNGNCAVIKKCVVQLGSSDRSMGDIDGDGRADLYVKFFSDVDGLVVEFDAWMRSAQRTTGADPALKFTPYVARGTVPAAWSSALPTLDGRTADVNGDGLLDLMTGTTEGTHKIWINSGARGRLAFRSAPGQPGAMADPQLVDINGDGRTDLLSRPGSNQAWQVRYATPEGGFPASVNGPVPGCENASTCGANALDLSQWYFNDFDGDGHLDYLTIQPPGPTVTNNVQTGSTGVNDRFVPRDVLRKVTNGLGAQTLIDYLPLTNNTVYRRDTGSRQSKYYGRGSPVLDLMVPLYVVSSVHSSAPTQADAAATSVLHYRYAGALLQGGGRGFLGFREIVTFDSNYTGTGADQCGPERTACHMATLTRYYQQFPFTSHPETTETWVANGAYVVDPCRTVSRDSELCRQSDTSGFTPFSASVATKIKSSRQNMACQGVLDENQNPSASLICPRPYPVAAPVGDGTGQCFNLNIDAPIVERSASGNRFAGGGLLNSINPDAFPQPLFVYNVDSAEDSYELQAPINTPSVSQVLHVHCYNQGFGNLGVTEMAIFATPIEQPGTALSKKIRRQRTVSTYVNDTLNWRLGRMTGSSVLHSNKVNGVAAFEDEVRTTSFDYQPGTSNLLKSERISSSPAAGQNTLAYTLNTYYDLDQFGNRTAAYNCSSDVTEVLCRDPTNATSPQKMHPVDANGPSVTVRRYSRTVYDSIGRFPTETRQPYFDPAVSVREWTERVSMRVLARDEFGEAISTEDANGVQMQSRRGIFGREYASLAEDGSSSSVTYRWCTGRGPAGQPQVSCPTGAQFREQRIGSGTPTRWIYHDVLGRAMVDVVQSFNIGVPDRDFSASCTFYDSYGRTVRSTEPFFLTGFVTAEPSFSADPCALAVYATTQTFDVLARGRVTTAPDSGVTEVKYRIMTLALPGGLTETRVQMTKTAPATAAGGSRTWTETKNAAGETVEISDPNGFATRQLFGPAGQLESVTRQVPGNALAIVTSLEFDQLGRKISQVDPDMGSWAYQYNAAGELIRQTDAKGQIIETDFDAAGRPWRRKATGTPTGPILDRVFSNGFEDGAAPTTQPITDTWQYDTASHGLGLLHFDQRSEQGLPAFQRTLSYDDLARVSGKVTQLDGVNHTESTVYDAIGRPFKGFVDYTEPSVNFAYDEGTETQFTARGHVQRICKTTDRTTTTNTCDQIYYQTLATDARGNTTSEKRHDNVELLSTRTFDPATGRLNTVGTGIGNGLQDLDYDFDVVGNLTRRKDWRRGGQEELLDYDTLDRLKRVRLDGVETMSLNYDVLGNLCNKTLAGTFNAYSYGSAAGCSGQSASGSAHQVKSAYGQTYLYDLNGDMTGRFGGSGGDYGIEYDAHRQARELLKTSSTTLLASSSFLYGPDGARYKRTDKVTGGVTSRTVRYVGALEREEFPNGERRIRHSIGGFLLLNREFNSGATGTQPSLFHNYLYADHLGSTDIIVSPTATVVEEFSFDAHGARRVPGIWTQPVLNFVPTTTLRGFTGHEHMDDLGLIHMNARIYDSRLGRFLQADSEVEPDATQGLNRYTYVLNNPLSLTDPTGHRVGLGDVLKGIAAIAISVFLPGYSIVFNANTFGAYVFAGFVAGTVAGGLQGGLWGAFSAGLFHGIGGQFEIYAKNSGGWLSNGAGGLSSAGRAAKILTHGVAGGVLNTLQGGKFGHGFVSAGVTEAFSPVLASMEDFTQVVGGALVGGTVSALTGGKFGNGAITGAFQMAFNQIAHKIHVAILVGDPGLGRHDSHDSFNLAAETEAIAQRKAGNTVEIIRVSGIDDFQLALIVGVPIDEVYYFGHSGKVALLPGETADEGTNIDATNVSRLNAGRLTKNAEIYLAGCDAGQGKSNIAQLLADQLGRRVHAFASYTHFTANPAMVPRAPVGLGPNRVPVYMRPDDGKRARVFSPESP